MAEKMVTIVVLPLRGIGGIGGPGSRGRVPLSEAKQWEKDGYARIVKDDEDKLVKSTAQQDLPGVEEE